MSTQLDNRDVYGTVNEECQYQPHGNWTVMDSTQRRRV